MDRAGFVAQPDGIQKNDGLAVFELAQQCQALSTSVDQFNVSAPLGGLRREPGEQFLTSSVVGHKRIAESEQQDRRGFPARAQGRAPAAFFLAGLRGAVGRAIGELS